MYTSKTLIFILFFSLTSSLASSQLIYPVGRVNVNTNNPGGIAEQVVPLIEEKELVAYVEEEWALGTAYLINEQVFSGYELRYDLVNNQVEIKIKEVIKIIPDNLLVSLVLGDDLSTKKRYFVKHTTFNNSSGLTPGLYEVMNEGDINVIRHYAYEKLEANYNPALDVGSRTASLVVKEDFFISIDLNLMPVQKNSKKFYALFGDKNQELRSKAKESKLNHNKLSELIAIVNIANEM